MHNLMRPGVNFIQMRHDDLCPALETQSSSGCTCKPEYALVSEEKWLADVNQDRKARRKAARESEKALRKMKEAR